MSDSWISSSSQQVFGSVRWCEVPDLQPATVYNIKMFAENELGQGRDSEGVTVSTLEETPGGPPTEVSVRVNGSQSLIVSWKVWVAVGRG